MANKQWRVSVKRKHVNDWIHVFNGEWQDKAGATRDANMVKPMLTESDRMILQTAETVFCVDDFEECEEA